MDLTQSIIPKSDQINADEIMAPVTYTIREVKAGSVEQPFDFLLVETDRAYRPSKTMRRVIVNAWGSEAANYAGRRLTLYREPSIKFGGQTVGGIRISHMSHIEGPVEVMAQTTRGKREKFTVQPLRDPEIASPEPPQGGAPSATDSGPTTPAAPQATTLQPAEAPQPAGGSGAAAGDGPPLYRVLASEMTTLSADDQAELKRRIPVEPGTSGKAVAELLGERWVRDLPGLLEQLRARDCTFAKLRDDLAAAAKFEHQVVTDTLPPSDSQERAIAGNPEVGAPIPMYGPGAPS